MSESELVWYYGLSMGAGLAIALIVYAISEYLRHPSRISVYAWMEPSASERQRLSIFVDNQTNSRTVIHEAGAIRKTADAFASPPGTNHAAASRSSRFPSLFRPTRR